MNIIKKVYRKLLRKRDPLAYAKLVGVNMRGGGTSIW